MKHFSITALCLFAASCAFAQTPNPFVSEVKRFYTIRKGDLLKAADRMPAEDYNFKPTPAVRTFGESIAHIADAQMGFCSSAKGEPKRLNAASKTTKADLVAALKTSFDECDSAFAMVTDANANDMMKAGTAERSRFGSLVYMAVHDAEQYGYIAVYLRLKNLVPPSTDSR